MADVSQAIPTATRAPAPRPRAGRPAALPGSERPATIEDWLRIPEEKRAELIHGRIVYHAFPGVKHGHVQGQLAVLLHLYNRRRTSFDGGGGGAPALGGWWISLEVDMAIGDLGCRPDVVGWRRNTRARAPEADARGVVTETPDFLCEVLSPSTALYDQGIKRDAYYQAGVPHYWLIDPTIQTLTLLERTERGYLIVQVAGPGETVRAAPFEGIEIPVDELFMDEEGELPAEAPANQPTPPPKAAAKKRAPRRRGG
jgi:Uma2 family endonuclease